MRQVNTLLSELLRIFPRYEFEKLEKQHKGNYYTKYFKGAINLHYLYDHSGSLPTFMVMTDGKHHDIRVARDEKKLDFALLPDSILSIDKAYLDYNWLWDLNDRGGVLCHSGEG